MKKDLRLPFEVKERNIIKKRDSKSDSNYGFDPYKRSVEELLKYGVINIDKPKGPTSHQVSAYVQQILGISKAGHSGTLDPAVTGCLPVALGRATRIVQTLLTAGKEYVAIMHIHKPIEEYQIFQVAEKFTGKIRQLPPIKSAVKRQYRERTVYYLKIIEVKGQDVLFRVGCEAGTYIRKLIHDMGKELGVGAHMAELRRTKAGPFNEDKYLATLQNVSDAFFYYKEENDESHIRKIVRPMEEAVDHLAKIWITDSTIDAICHGADLAAPGIAELHDGIEPDQLVALMSLKGELVAYGRAKVNSSKMLEPKGIVVNTMKVFMDTGTYPKIKKETTPTTSVDKV